MSITPQSAKAKGSRLERNAGALLGGKRAPLSGAVGGGDIWLEQDSLFANFVFECKARAKIPFFINQAMEQCRASCIGPKKPAVIFKEDGGRMFVMIELQDFVDFSKSIAEVGQGSAIKSDLRAVRRLIDEIEQRI